MFFPFPMVVVRKDFFFTGPAASSPPLFQPGNPLVGTDGSQLGTSGSQISTSRPHAQTSPSVG